MKVLVRCTTNYNDIELNEEKFPNDEYVVEKERAIYLQNHNAAEIVKEEETTKEMPKTTINSSTFKKYKKRVDD